MKKQSYQPLFADVMEELEYTTEDSNDYSAFSHEKQLELNFIKASFGKKIIFCLIRAFCDLGILFLLPPIGYFLLRDKMKTSLNERFNLKITPMWYFLYFIVWLFPLFVYGSILLLAIGVI